MAGKAAAEYRPGSGRNHGTEREGALSTQTWSEVDTLLEANLIPADSALDWALKSSAQAGLPAIHVSPAQGKLLHLLARSQGARRILEIGTLGGYSSIWLGR